jgi:inhibitor of KinA sporulation pathway (predicted exonuclease)
METIEIGAVMVAGDTLKAAAEFQAFVRPVRNLQLTAFCTGLTTITQTDVDRAETFPEILKEFLAWAGTFPDWRFCFWGAFDTKQIRRDCNHWGIDVPWP